MNATVRFYLGLIRRRLPAMLVLFVLAAAVGFGFAMTLPAKYEASARLLVESAQIPNELAASTVRTGATEQLQIIEQRLMTRANLIDIANKYSVFAGDDMTPDQIVSAMRSAVRLRTSGGRDRATIMSVTFESERPTTAANVVNELLTLILREDTSRRRVLAEQTLDFFEDEVERLSVDLRNKGAEILAFKETNKDALPEGLNYRLSRQSQLQEQLNTAARDRAALNEQRGRLLAVGTSGRATPASQLSPSERALRAAEDELNGALAIYSETNPKVVILKSRIDALRRQVAEEQGANSEEDPSVDPAQRVLDLQIAEIDTRIEYLDQQMSQIQSELTALRDSIERTPENAIRLEALERDFTIVQRQYDRAVAALDKAQTGERIEVLSKGERISVIEQATVPTEPTSPNRRLIAGSGLIMGMGLATAFFILTELLNFAVRRPVDIVKGLGVQPLATIGFIETPGARRRRRALTTIAIGAIVIGVPTGLWAIHEFYMPLDLLTEKVLDRLGV